MRSAAGLALALIAALIAGCKDIERRHGDDCKAKDALVEARQRTDADGLDGPAVPRLREAYCDLRQETTARGGQDDQADLSPDAQWLAFASTDLSHDADIFMKHATAPSLVQKSFHPTQEQFPRFSADGHHLAFASDRSGNWDVYVMDVAVNGAVRQVTDGPADDIAPSWSRDGRRIAYSSRAPDGEWEIWIANLDNAQLTRIGPGLFPRWSPMDDRIVFQRARQRADTWYGVYCVQADGNNVVEIVGSSEWAAIDPCWSPDGAWIAFASVYRSPAARADGRKMTGDDIWIVRPDGTSLTQVTVDAAPEWNPCWGTNGRIYFTAFRDGAQTLWSISPLIPGVAFAPPK